VSNQDKRAAVAAMPFGGRKSVTVLVLPTPGRWWG